MAAPSRGRKPARARAPVAAAPRARATIPVRAPKLSHLVAESLRAQIVGGELGEQLPSESELLRRFGVSRPTLREALRVVESEGLIQLGRGARTGATVLGPSVEAAARYGEIYLAAQKTTLGEVHEVRMLLEPSLVGRLASRRSAELLKVLRACVATQRSALAAGDYVTAVNSLNVFHRHMVEHSENRALSLLAGILEGIPAKVYPQFLQSGDTPSQQAFRRRTNQSVEAHAKLVELIAAGNPAAAESFWRDYMEETARYLTKTGLAPLRVQLPKAW
jgi:DNA-binding FadR family transcriptional regulator